VQTASKVVDSSAPSASVPAPNTALSSTHTTGEESLQTNSKPAQPSPVSPSLAQPTTASTAQTDSGTPALPAVAKAETIQGTAITATDAAPVAAQTAPNKNKTDASTVTVVIPNAQIAGNDVGTAAPEQVKASVLTIQPRITTSRVTINEDLAAAVPTAPDVSRSPNKAPSPQPTGAIGRITATLAGSVVPNWHYLPATQLGGWFEMVIVLLGLTLVSIFSPRIESWIRKGGYAHAARSDVAGSLVSFLATPYRLGYVPAEVPIHSPFLMVSDIKSFMITFPMLQKGGN
jgi:hypothetical protein